jgi:hypothetical protein
MRNENYLSVAEKIFASEFPNAACGFVGGSVVSGTHTSTSDIDLIILYNDKESDSYRYSILREGWPVELFVHNLFSQDYFLESGIKNGECATADMIVKGIIIGPNKKLGEARKTKAQDIIAKGPTPLIQDQIDFRRYMITDKLDDLRHPRNPDYAHALLALLYTDLGDFYLRANGKWSGTGKQLVRLMNLDDPSFQQRFSTAFAKAFSGDISNLESLSKEILNPFGGLLFEGYKSIAEIEKMVTS